MKKIIKKYYKKNYKKMDLFEDLKISLINFNFVTICTIHKISID